MMSCGEPSKLVPGTVEFASSPKATGGGLLRRESFALVTLKEWLVIHVYSYGAKAFTASAILCLLSL